MDGYQPLTCLSCNTPLSLPQIAPWPLYNLCLRCLHNSQHGVLYLSEPQPPPPIEAAAVANYAILTSLPWLSGGENAYFMLTYIGSVSNTVMSELLRTGGTGVLILNHAANELQIVNIIGRIDNTIDLTLRLQCTGGTGARLHTHVADEAQREIMTGREENPIDLTLRLATSAEEAIHQE